MFKANTLYEGEYLLGTSIARPLISKRLVEIAEKEGADAIAHGATGKGNDQIRFEIGSYSLNPEIQVIAPWRTWDYSSRADLVDYCKLHQIEIDASPDEPLYSTDENLLHTSYEGEILEDPSIKAPDEIWQRTVAPVNALARERAAAPELVLLAWVQERAVEPELALRERVDLEPELRKQELASLAQD